MKYVPFKQQLKCHKKTHNGSECVKVTSLSIYKGHS